jgi:hypothetical protein
MKVYTTKTGATLGSVARKFEMPSWKYLYEINKSKIGDNPDLLKEGTILQIPLLDTTGGVEKIKAKGVDPFEYTGGLRYAYPWIPFSASFMNNDGNVVKKSNEDGRPLKYEIHDRESGNLLASGEMEQGDELETLIPNSQDIEITMDGCTWDIDVRDNLR